MNFETFSAIQHTDAYVRDQYYSCDYTDSSDLDIFGRLQSRSFVLPLCF